MTMRVLSRANVVHLVGRSALHAARLGLLAGERDPEDAVGVGGEAGAADVLLVAGRVDDNGVLWGACNPLEPCPASTLLLTASSNDVFATYRDGWRPMASCRRCRYPASFRALRDAQDRWLARHRWERYRAGRRVGEGRPCP
jgi:hypothetical protein